MIRPKWWWEIRNICNSLYVPITNNIEKCIQPDRIYWISYAVLKNTDHFPCLMHIAYHATVEGEPNCVYAKQSLKNVRKRICIHILFANGARFRDLNKKRKKVEFWINIIFRTCSYEEWRMDWRTFSTFDIQYYILNRCTR